MATTELSTCCGSIKNNDLALAFVPLDSALTQKTLNIHDFLTVGSVVIPF